MAKQLPALHPVRPDMEPPRQISSEGSARPVRQTPLWVFVLLGGLLFTLGLVLVIERTSYWSRKSTSPVAVTNAIGIATMNSVQGYAGTYGAPPSALTSLVPNYFVATPTDGWRRPFVYGVDTAGKTTLISYGADGKAGGTGDDADLWWEWSPGGQPTQGVGQPP